MGTHTVVVSFTVVPSDVIYFINMSYTLYYFPLKGAGETIRIIFAYAGVEYTDKRIPREEWADWKEKMPLQAMPVLEIDGKQYCQSAALVRYLARKYDLYGNGPAQGLVIDEIGESIVDMTKGVGPIFGEQDQKKKQEMMKTMVAETFPKFVKFIEKRVCESKGNFLFGDKLTVGDLIIYRTMDFLKDFAAGMELADYDWTWASAPLKKLYENVASDPKIAAWIKKRPQSAM